jgi:hypothetical protein
MMHPVPCASLVVMMHPVPCASLVVMMHPVPCASLVVMQVVGEREVASQERAAQEVKNAGLRRRLMAAKLPT